MKNALTKDIIRTIRKGKKRFFSILLITALGVTMMTGLKAACVDLRYSADALYDEQKLFDIQVSSTLGLDDNDITALADLDEVTAAEGEYSRTVSTDVAGVHEDAQVRTLGKEMNLPTLVEGTLPQAADEIAVTQTYLKETGKQIGDTLFIEETDLEEDEDPAFKNTEYTITAEVLNPFDVNNKDGSVSFRSTATASYTFFVSSEAVASDIYTAAYVRVEGADDLMCYTDAYEEKIEAVQQEIDTTLKESQQQMRYDTVYGDAMEEYTEAKDEAEQELADAQEEIDEGWDKLNDSKQELADGKKKLADGKSELKKQESDAAAQIRAGRVQIADGYAKLEEGRKQLEESAQQIAEGEKKLAAAREELTQKKEETYAQIDDGLAQLTDGRTQAQEGLETIEAQLKLLDPEGTGADSGDAALTQLYAQLSALQGQVSELDAQITALKAQRTAVEEQFAAAEAEIESQEAALRSGKESYEAGQKQLDASQTQLDTSSAELNEKAASADAQIASAWKTIRENEQELEDGEAELTKGEQELLDGQTELDESKADVQQELDEAKEDIDAIEMAKWYIQDRGSLSGYSNVDGDATSIEGLATFLPMIFFVVAILISLTTITRMVEEERGLIGTYKALGFKNSEIRRKYLVYAAGASIAGGIAGDFCGFVILPKIIFTFFKIMYTIPTYLLRFELKSGLVGIVLFTAGVLLAVGFAVKTELAQMPAALMRPLAPKKGSRIFLEYIPAIWRKMSFLNKVTARNLFRYKKRLIMTVVGIMGCTGLLICGFAIKDTVTELMYLQYGNVDRYDIMAVAQSSDNDLLLSYMEDRENIEEYLNVQIDSVKIKNAEGSEQTVQMMVIPDDSDISAFVKLADVSGAEIPLAAEGVMVTHSASDVLGLEEGDELEVQDLSLNLGTFQVAAVTEYYLGNMIYVSQSCYEAVFEEEYAPNAVLVNLTESCRNDDPIAYADDLGKKDGVVSTLGIETLKAEFSKAFQLINLVVYVILILAAALAFVVLFTLSTTNISERCRELATIKVLGFFDREVHLYVNKETLILSGIGIVLGIPAGRAISSCLTWALKIPGLYFAVNIHKISYVICAVIAFVFALIVNQITNRLLNAIDPVEALKSVE